MLAGDDECVNPGDNLSKALHCSITAPRGTIATNNSRMSPYANSKAGTESANANVSSIPTPTRTLRDSQAGHPVAAGRPSTNARQCNVCAQTGSVLAQITVAGAGRIPLDILQSSGGGRTEPTGTSELGS